MLDERSTIRGAVLPLLVLATIFLTLMLIGIVDAPDSAPPPSVRGDTTVTPGS